MPKYESHNIETGFHKAIQGIDGFIWVSNLMLVIVGVVCFFLTKCSYEYSFPGWISDYDYGINMSANSLLLLVLDNAHNRYYQVYLKSSELTVLGNSIDLAIKVLLLATTVLQFAIDGIIILFTALAYAFTFLRNVELRSSLDSENPLRKRIETNWLPYNLRHNMVVWLFCIFFYLIKFKIVYVVSAWLMNTTLSRSVFYSDDFILMHNSLIFVYVLFFDIYWMHRVLRKVKISKSNPFRFKSLKKLTESMEAYNEANDQQ